MQKKRGLIAFNSPTILIFVGVCFLATILNAVTAGVSNRLLFMTYHSALSNPLTYLRFFTHVFGHSGWSHFMGNATYLLLLGPLLEEKYGAKRMVQVMAITALATGLINYCFFWNVALCGASGVVFAFILLASFTGFRDGTIPLTFILVAVIFGGEQIYEGLMLEDNISNMAHIVGGIVGATWGYVLNRNRG